MSSIFDDYFNAGLCDGLQDPEGFMGYMKDRHWTLFEYYLAGIRALEQAFGHKAYRKYAAWFDVLDEALLHAENHFRGRFGNE